MTGNDAAGAYDRNNTASLAGRNLEGYAFAQAARRLQLAAEEPDDRQGIIDALRFNRDLWTIVQASLVDDDGSVPADLRADLLSLSLFVDERTAEAAARPDPRLLDALIDVNRAIAQGLLADA